MLQTEGVRVYLLNQMEPVNQKEPTVDIFPHNNLLYRDPGLV